MEIIETKETIDTIKTIVHKTDKGFNIIETITNGQTAITLDNDDQEYWPIIMDLPDNWIDDYEDFGSFQNYAISINSMKDIDEDKIYFLYQAGHMLFDKDMKIVSIPYIFNYIGSFQERQPDDQVYKKIIDALVNHPFVLKLEDKEIPYYNSEFSGQRGVRHAKVVLSQEKYEELYHIYKDMEYWSSRIHDAITKGQHNIYGKEIDALIQEYNSTN